jgi:amino acid transporter
MFSFTRVVALAMATVLCFAFLVPLALHRGNTTLAIAISAMFLVYLAANVVLMLRYRRR